jgi:hypothetical protein
MSNRGAEKKTARVNARNLTRAKGPRCFDEGVDRYLENS